MNEVTLYGFYEETLLDDVSVIIANLHGDNDHDAVYDRIKNHPNFKQNYQLFAKHLFGRLETALDKHCEQINLFPVKFHELQTTNGYIKAVCDYDQNSFDAIMALAYLPLHSKYNYGADDLGVAPHTYFWWSELENDSTYAKILELFDFAE